jgi:hypothetical protein
MKLNEKNLFLIARVLMFDIYWSNRSWTVSDRVNNSVTNSYSQ